MQAKVTASWIFDRLIEEPERLKRELMNQIGERQARDIELTFAMLDQYYAKYTAIKQSEKIAAELRLATTPVLEIIKDHEYVTILFP